MSGNTCRESMMKSFLQSTCWAILLDSYGIANTLAFSIAITLVLILTTVAIYRTLKISNLEGEQQTIKKPPSKKRRERKASAQSPRTKASGKEVARDLDSLDPSKHVAIEADENSKHCPKSVPANGTQCQKQGGPKVSTESKVMANRTESTRRIANKGRSESVTNEVYSSSDTLSKLTIENDLSNPGSFAEKPRLRIASSSTIDTTVSDDISCGSTLVPSSTPFVPSPRQVGKVVQFDAKTRKSRKQEKASTRSSANADSRQQCQGKKAGRKDFINRRANDSDVPSRWDALKPTQSASGHQQRVSNWSNSNRNARAGHQHSTGKTGRSNTNKNASRAKQSSPAPMQPVISTASTISSPVSPPRVRTEYSSQSFFASEQNRPSSWRGPPPGLESSFPYVPPVQTAASQPCNTNKWHFPMSNNSGSSLVSADPSPTFPRQTVLAEARRNDFETSDSRMTHDSPTNVWRTGSTGSIQENPCGLRGRTILDAPIGGTSQPWGSPLQPRWNTSALGSSSTLSGSSNRNGSNRYQAEDSFFAMNRTTMHSHTMESTSVDLFHQLDSCQSPIVSVGSREMKEWVPRKTSFSRLRDNPFAPNSEEMSDAEHRIEAELQELGGQMVGSVLD